MPFFRSFKGAAVPPLRTSDANRLHGMIRSGHAVPERARRARTGDGEQPGPGDRRATTWPALPGTSSAPNPAARCAASPPAAASAIRFGSGQGVAGSQAGGGGGAGGSGTSSLAGAALIQQIGPVTPQLDPIETFNAGMGHQTSIQTQLVAKRQQLLCLWRPLLQRPGFAGPVIGRNGAVHLQRVVPQRSRADGRIEPDLVYQHGILDFAQSAGRFRSGGQRPLHSPGAEERLSSAIWRSGRG